MSLLVIVWLGGWMVRSRVQTLASPLSSATLGKLFTRAYVIKQYNLVPVSLAAGKVTVGLASHWPCVRDISGSPPTGSRPRRGRWAPAYALLVECGELYLYLTLVILRREYKKDSSQKWCTVCWELKPSQSFIWQFHYVLASSGTMLENGTIFAGRLSQYHWWPMWTVGWKREERGKGKQIV